MESIGLKIRKLMEQQNIDAPTLAKRIGKSKQAVYDMLEKDDMNTSVLRQLAEVFGVPVTFFVAEEQLPTMATAHNHSVAAINSEVRVGGNTAVLEERIARLQELLDEKERTIKILMKGSEL